MTGHPCAINCICKVGDGLVFTGSSDGIIRCIEVSANSDGKFLGVLGEHDGYSIEGLAINQANSIMASISHSSSVKLWDISEFTANEMNINSDDNASDNNDIEKQRPSNLPITLKHKNEDGKANLQGITTTIFKKSKLVNKRHKIKQNTSSHDVAFFKDLL